ncbi:MULTISPECIES: short chain dehydrogenase [unclassified Arcicella]|uniref:short chain dehydrogenase n=1 Tax=unclassified Arcicella TaxID=2644986 RepID=UPI002860C783|nr:MULTISPECIES: short chain dehydrogenase [unclassified Arcicella]MDR6561774.1 NAD(P)-dependent dehydrogenase (short-subunit alcohol dehydrogenase family) [Arcicella sp. BE51]MDR6812554.1 NAD(P)-dependent dehydrogenase (short-subunit alcohol dehydrogenase family) [Arcicella sp. BE140]MDR6823674.1 NAD(P)-dependent dehydrogenase (short-subunit alcohol dehydrogenase family) [Arcicella sp. BE139]
MKIIIVGATGTMGKHLVSVLEKEHEIIKVGAHGGDIITDITSTESIENMFKQVGSFDALISTAGPTYVGPWKKMTDKEFRKGLEGKLMGQINLVLIGQHFINPKGSFTLISGALTYEPQLNFANASAANGAVEAFVRAAAIELENGVRINAVSPTVIEASPQYFPFFPGEIPVTMKQLEYGFRKSVFGANTGQIIKP